MTLRRPVRVCTSELQMVAPSSLTTTSPSASPPLLPPLTWNWARLRIGAPSSGGQTIIQDFTFACWENKADGKWNMGKILIIATARTCRGIEHKTWSLCCAYSATGDTVQATQIMLVKMCIHREVVVRTLYLFINFVQDIDKENILLTTFM